MMAFAPIDNYCERLDASLFSEPINAISNAAFLIAAWLLWKHYKSVHIKDSAIAALIALITVIGLGSFTFHTAATTIAMFADIIPITCFVFYYLWLASRRLLGFSHTESAFFQIALLLAAIFTMRVPAEYSFNGSIMYFPCLVALMVIGAILSYRHHPAARNLYMASMLFIISLTLRSVDMSVCEGFPLGTHFLWHICNGAVLYILMRAIFLTHTTQK